MYRFLVWTAILLTAAWVGWSIYDSMFSTRQPGDMAYLEGNTLFEDREYQRALAKYEELWGYAQDESLEAGAVRFWQRRAASAMRWLPSSAETLSMPVLALFGTEPDTWSIPHDVMHHRLDHIPMVEREGVPDVCWDSRS